MRKKIVKRVRGTRSTLCRRKYNSSISRLFRPYSICGDRYNSFSVTREDTNISATFSNLSKYGKVNSTTKGGQ